MARQYQDPFINKERSGVVNIGSKPTLVDNLHFNLAYDIGILLKDVVSEECVLLIVVQTVPEDCP